MRIFFAILLAISSCTSIVRAEPFVVGDVFPEIVLPRLADGAPSSVGAYRGRKVLLLVYASW
ncbi:MAG: hypothetical protein KDA28_02935 [Phycisphaerales bacterium]|nr:hypothetical protein [Phycisphaerales bacterium]